MVSGRELGGISRPRSSPRPSAGEHRVRARRPSRLRHRGAGGPGQLQLGNLGIQPTVRPEIVALVAGQPAAQAGLKVGDVIVAVEGTRTSPYDQLLTAIRSHPDQPLTLTIKRGDARQDITVTPRVSGDTAKLGATFSFYETYTVKPGRSGP